MCIFLIMFLNLLCDRDEYEIALIFNSTKISFLSSV